MAASNLQIGGLYHLSWDFGTGRGPQSKFTILLTSIEKSGDVLHCFPTSTDRSGVEEGFSFGCNPKEYGSCFVIREGTKVTNTGFEFKKQTHIYMASGFHCNNIQALNSATEPKFHGVVRPDLIQALKDCMHNSEDVPIKYLRFWGLV